MLFPPIVDGVEIIETFVQTAAIRLVNRLECRMEPEPFSDCFSIPRALRLVAVRLRQRGRAGDVEHTHHRDPVIPAPPRSEARHRFLAPPDDLDLRRLMNSNLRGDYGRRPHSDR